MVLEQVPLDVEHELLAAERLVGARRLHRGARRDLVGAARLARGRRRVRAVRLPRARVQARGTWWRRRTPRAGTPGGSCRGGGRCARRRRGPAGSSPGGRAGGRAPDRTRRSTRVRTRSGARILLGPVARWLPGPVHVASSRTITARRSGAVPSLGAEGAGDRDPAGLARRPLRRSPRTERRARGTSPPSTGVCFAAISRPPDVWASARMSRSGSGRSPKSVWGRT